MSALRTMETAETTSKAALQYAGFWRRVGAFLIDSIVVSILLVPALWLLEKVGVLAPAASDAAAEAAQLVKLLNILNSLRSANPPPDALANTLDVLRSSDGGSSSLGPMLVVAAVLCIAFWLARQATPGKIIVSARVVDAKTLGPITPGQAIGRYLGYFASIIPFCLGFLWIAFDPRKQGWHDKLAGTLVIVDPPPKR